MYSKLFVLVSNDPQPKQQQQHQLASLLVGIYPWIYRDIDGIPPKK